MFLYLQSWFLTNRFLFFSANLGHEFLFNPRGLGRTEWHRCRPRHRMHDMLRESHRCCSLHVRTHVHVLRMCIATVAWQRGRTVSPMQGHHQGRHTYIQIVNLPIQVIDLNKCFHSCRRLKRSFFYYCGCVYRVLLFSP